MATKTNFKSLPSVCDRRSSPNRQLGKVSLQRQGMEYLPKHPTGMPVQILKRNPQFCA